MLDRKTVPVPFASVVSPETIQTTPPDITKEPVASPEAQPENVTTEDVDRLDTPIINPSSMNEQQLKARFLSHYSWPQVLQMFLDEQRKSTVEVKLDQLTLKLDVSLVIVQDQTVTLGFDPKTVTFSLKNDTEVTLVIDKKEMKVIYAGHQISIPGVGFNLLVFFFPSES